MKPLGKPAIAYPETFAAIGRYAAKQKMSDLCVMEFESGVIVTGTVFYVTGETFGRGTETKIFSFTDLQKLVKAY